MVDHQPVDHNSHMDPYSIEVGPELVVVGSYSGALLAVWYTVVAAAEVGLVVVAASNFVASHPSTTAAPSVGHTYCQVSRQETGSGCSEGCCRDREVGTCYSDW